MENKKRSISTKTFAILLAVMLIIGCMAGGTIAWLAAKTTPVVNTFNFGDIKIGLQEDHTGPYKVVPGVDITKDPEVTVYALSEECWLFVKAEENGFIDELRWEIADGWQEVPGVDNVYYREVPSNPADQKFEVIKGNKVTVLDSLTKAKISSLNSNPTLTFTAYAVQKAGFTTVAAAWAEASKS